MHAHRSSCRPSSGIDGAAVASTLALCVTVAAVIIVATPSFAQSPPGHDSNALHDAENPIATRISVPFQSNTYFSSGPLEKTGNVVIIQPIVPTKLTQDWNLITRWVTRVVYVPRRSPDHGSAFGLGNLQPEFYFSPAHTGKVIWGVGPKLYLPTATSAELGINRMGGGLAAAALAINGPWIIGIIAHNVWAGSGHERVDQMTLSPFVYFNVKDGWYFVSSPVITSNWAATSSGRWTVPLGGGIGRLFKIDNQAVNTRVQGLYNAARPDFAPSWQLQVQVQFLFPKH
jgi:hypothetical protein